MVEESKRPVINGVEMPDFTVPPVDVLNTRIEQVIGDRFIQKCGNTEREREETSLTESASVDQLQGLKYVGLFFSAEWCPPCKHMLRPLKNFYTDVNLQERTLELILVSSDRAQDEWKRHHATMPWMSLPWGDERADKLRAKFQIMGVPALVILDAETGFVVTEKARKDLGKDVTEVYASWKKLLDLKKVKAVERAEQDAIALAQKKEREWAEKMKKEAEKIAQEAAAAAQVNAEPV